MTAFDAGVLKGTDGQPDQRITFLRSVHGPVVGYANVGGRRVAIASKRASYGRDTLDQLPFQGPPQGQWVAGVVHPRVPALAADLQRVLRRRPPHRRGHDRPAARPRPDVDPGLPTNGDGNHEWRGFLSAAKHPQQIDPSGGRIVNWKNKAARGFEAADNAWNYGLSHRVDLLNRNLDKRTKHSLTSVVANAGSAARSALPRATPGNRASTPCAWAC